MCATYILLEGLENLGADVDIDIPDRILDGYGLNRHLIDRAFEAGVDTIVTCDNGIAAAEEIAYGKSLGMTIIVTDQPMKFLMKKERKRKMLFTAGPPMQVVVRSCGDCSYPFKGCVGQGGCV